MPLVPVMSAMECLGVGFLPEKVAVLANAVNSRVAALEAEARAVASAPNFNLSSPEQVSRYCICKRYTSCCSTGV
jgi:DNA polymerase I-like protein with 3'-5' exonuclease and polymerase domains